MGYTINFDNQTSTKIQATVNLLYYPGSSPIVELKPAAIKPYRAPGVYCIMSIEFLEVGTQNKTVFPIDKLKRCTSMDIIVKYNTKTPENPYVVSAQYHDNKFTKVLGKFFNE